MKPKLHVRVAWEHTHRELLPALLLLHALAERGLSWSLEQVRELADVPVDGAAPRALLLPYYYDPLDNDLFLAHEHERMRGQVVVNMAWEQMHFRCGRGYLLPDGPLAKGGMLHCAWGPRFAGLLEEHGVDPARIGVTGHLRLDLYSHRALLRDKADLAAEYGLRADAPWVLLPFNFNLAYVRPRAIETLKRRNYALTDEFVAGVATARDAFMALCREAALAHPEREVIVRVHPAGFEASSMYEQPDRPANLHIIADWDIAHWIVAAETVVVWNSTSAIEAMVAGTKVACFEPEPFAERFDYDVPRIVPRLAHRDDVLAFIGSGGASVGPCDWARFGDWYAHHDGANHARVADLMVEVAGRHGALALPEKMPLGRRGWQRRLGRRLGLSRRPPDRRAPPADALAAAVAVPSPAPLGEFLR